MSSGAEAPKLKEEVPLLEVGDSKPVVINGANHGNGSPSRRNEQTKKMDRLWKFLRVYWQGLVTVLVPLVFLPLAFTGASEYQCLYVVLVVVIFWVTEVVPLAIASMIPIFAFPFFGILSSNEVTTAYFKESVMLFMGALFISLAFEYSQLHKRLALRMVKIIGVSHRKLTFSLFTMTMFLSMWVTNAAAATMMIPIIVSILEVLEANGLGQMYEKKVDAAGQEVKVPTAITECYFLGIAFSSSIGGIGTLVGTATNLILKGLFESTFKDAPEYLSFPLFMLFNVPAMLIMEMLLYIWMNVFYLGLFRPKSNAAQRATMTQQEIQVAQEAIDSQLAKIGKMTWHEGITGVLFLLSIFLYFTRSPQMFMGWADYIHQHRPGFSMQDSSVSMFIVFLMFVIPARMDYLQYFKTGKDVDSLPSKCSTGVVVWKVYQERVPWSLLFLIGSGFAVSDAMKKSGMAAMMGNQLQQLRDWPTDALLFIIIIFATAFTNFASNTAIANILVPIIAHTSVQIKRNPLYYIIAAGISASWAFHLPIGTPSNAIVQGFGNIPTKSMVVAAIGPTIITVTCTFLNIVIFSPVVWPDIKEFPSWAANMTASGH